MEVLEPLLVVVALGGGESDSVLGAEQAAAWLVWAGTAASAGHPAPGQRKLLVFFQKASHHN